VVGTLNSIPSISPPAVPTFYPTIWNTEKLLPSIPTFFGKLEEGMQESNDLTSSKSDAITANKARIQNSLQIKSQQIVNVKVSNK
jgi:hypothetical protein